MKWGIFLILLIVPISMAFDWDTHNEISKDILLDNYPECEEQILEGSVYPDKVLKDFSRHHCYTDCPVDDLDYCPKGNGCPAATQAAIWIEKEASGCERAFNLAVATHYLSDVYVPMHNTVKEDYEGCHKDFEDKIGDVINQDKFAITQCCKNPEACFSFDNQDYDQMLDQIRSELNPSSNLITGAYLGVNVNVFNTYVLLIAMSIVFLGIYRVFGRKH